jgi:hypothetical protein
MRLKVYNNRLKVYGGRVKYNYPNESKAVVDGIQITDQLNAVPRFYAHFIVGMEINESIWTKNTALYGMLGGTAAAHKWNWKDMRDLDAAFRLTYTGTITHSNLNGFKADGTTGYADTYLAPATHISNTSSHVSIFSNSNSGDAVSTDIGCSSGTDFFNMSLRYAGNLWGGRMFGGSSAYTNTPENGFYLQTKIISNLIKSFKNETLFLPNNTSSGNVSTITRSIFIGGINSPGGFQNPSNEAYQFISIGSGLTDTEARQMSQILNFAQKMRANF